MLRFLNIELKKILPYKASWIFMGLYCLILPFVLGIFKNTAVNGSPFDLSKIYAFPGIWGNITYRGSFLHFIPSFLIIMLMGNEYTYRTIRQNIITGYSRLDFVIGKTMVIAIISLTIASYTLIIGFLYGNNNTPEPSFAQIFETIYMIPVFSLQTFAYMMFALFIVTLIKRSALSMILYLIYFIMEFIIRLRSADKSTIYLPGRTFSDLTPFPLKDITSSMGLQWSEHSLPTAIVLTLVYSAIFFYSSYYILSKRDL